MGLRRLLPVAFTAVLVLPAAPALAQPAAEPAPDSTVEVAALVRDAGGHLRVERTRAASRAEGRAVAGRWRAKPGVLAADVAVPVRALGVPAPDPVQAQQWGLAAGRFPSAWEAGDAAGQVVAVLDSGVDLQHPDLAAMLVRGRDLVDGDSVPQDQHGHGTHVTGVVGAIAGNGVGGAGAALRTKVLPVRVLDAQGAGDSADVAEGVLWAVANGATVLNLSLGGPQNDAVLARAVQEALARGVPVVAAAGNEALSGNPVNYPAALPGVVAVGAVDRYGARASFSSTGSHLDVVAPGVDVLSTVPGGGHAWRSGTSMAAPFVAGAMALLRAAAPTATPGTLTSRLTAGARDLGAAGFDPGTGYGLVDAAASRALLTSSTPLPAPAPVAVSPIAAKHAALGGDAGLLGPATGPEVDVPGGRLREFLRGAIWWSAATGAREVHGAVLSTYRAHGAAGGVLGFPTTDELATADGRGRYSAFQRGAVYWTPSTGAREVHGGIRDTWARLGAERSALGYPVTDELGTRDGRGRYSAFERGSVYWTPSTGAREVRGGIRDAWFRLGGERSALGYPVTDELGTSDGRGRYNTFERGSVLWTATTGAHEVRGAIRDAWVASGAERGPLGYPTTDEYDVAGGRAGDFERGRVRWDGTTGAVTVTRW